MTQSRPLPKEILDAFVEKVGEKACIGENSFYEEYNEGQYHWELEAYFRLTHDCNPRFSHTSISCWDEEREEEVECSNYHSYELESIIEERCRPIWVEEMDDAEDIERTYKRLQWNGYQ